MPSISLKEWLKNHRKAVLIGTVAGAIALVLQQQNEAALLAQADLGPTVRVLALTAPAKPGETLSDQSLHVIEMPLRYAHPLAVSASDRELVTGLLPARLLERGQPLLWSDLQPPNLPDGAASALVRPKERALTLRVQSTSGARLARANDHVDIFGTFHDAAGGVSTVPILQNVLVIAIGENDGRMADTLTVSVSPQEAALLTLAQETGRLAYALRNEFDTETVPSLGRVALRDLLDDAPRNAVQEQRNIRILKGKD